MKIRISKQGDSFVADPVDKPGMPAVGRGATIAEALGDFLIHYQKDLGLQIELDESAERAEAARWLKTVAQR